MAETFTYLDFFQRFPTDEACMDHLMHVRYGEQVDCPKCGKTGKFHRVRKRPVYQCAWCGHQVSPMAGTPFERSHTPLQKWFYAMYLFSITRHGVSGKELQRQLGVTYKTAWRMGHEIRKYMGDVDGDPPLTDHVEIDETYIGGRKPKIKGFTGRGAKGKTVVMGILERDGELFTKVVPNASRKSLIPPIFERIKAGTRISADEWLPYRILPYLGYKHEVVNHRAKEYARGDVHVNSLEGMWSILKRSIRSTHVHVSAKYLPNYLAEFEYRFNMRKRPATMFTRLVWSFTRAI
jgi:transposase-like protein